MNQSNEFLFPSSLNFKKALTIAIPAAFISLLLIKLSWFLIFIPILIAIALMFGERVFIFTSITSSLVLTSTISIKLRMIVQIGNVLILLYLFFKRYGLNFNLYPKPPKSVLLLIGFLYLSMIISTIFSNYVLLGIKEISRLSVFLIIVYCFEGLLKSDKDLKLYLYALFISGIIYFLNVFYGFALNGFSIFLINVEQLIIPKGDYINLNSIGSFFIIIISILLGYLLVFKDRKERPFVLFFLIVFSAGLILTNSRAAILSTAISSLLIIYLKNKKIFYTSILIVLIIFIAFLFVSPLNEYLDLYFRVDRLTTGRNQIWETVFNVIKHNPILGVGPAGTKYELFKYIPFMLGTNAGEFILFHYNEIEFGHAHNFYLFFLSDLGILGFITSLMLPVIYIRMGFQTMKKFKYVNSEYFWLSASITAAGIGLFIRGFFEWGNLISYGTLESDLPFWLIFLILIYLYQKPFSNIRNNISEVR
jgi:O-antigen ligase